MHRVQETPLNFLLAISVPQSSSLTDNTLISPPSSPSSLQKPQPVCSTQPNQCRAPGVLILPHLCTDPHSGFTASACSQASPMAMCKKAALKRSYPLQRKGAVFLVRHTGQLSWADMVLSFSYLLQIHGFLYESEVKQSTGLWQHANRVLHDITLLFCFGARHTDYIFRF